MFSGLYNISLLLIYFIHSSFLIPYPYHDPPLSPWVNTSLFSIPVSLFLLCYINLFILLFVFHVKVATYKILSFFVWYFTKHYILQVHPSCCNWQNFILFYTWVIGNILVYICVCMYKYIQILLLRLLFYVFLCHEWSMSPTFVLIAATATIMQVSEQELLLSFKNFFFLFLYSSLARWSNS